LNPRQHDPHICEDCGKRPAVGVLTLPEGDTTHLCQICVPHSPMSDFRLYPQYQAPPIPVRNPPPDTGKYDDLDPTVLDFYQDDLIDIYWGLEFPDPTLMVRILYERLPGIDPQLFSPLCSYTINLFWGNDGPPPRPDRRHP
jgi:hypothetical protein